MDEIIKNKSGTTRVVTFSYVTINAVFRLFNNDFGESRQQMLTKKFQLPLELRRKWNLKSDHKSLLMILRNFWRREILGTCAKRCRVSEVIETLLGRKDFFDDCWHTFHFFSSTLTEELFSKCFIKVLFKAYLEFQHPQPANVMQWPERLSR